MKKCKLCKKEKEYQKFYEYKQSGKDGQIWPYYDCYCKKCRSNYQSQRRRDVKIKAIQYLGGKCNECGLIDDPCVYDFHHLDPEQKDFTLGQTSKSFSKIKEELDKCILLCSNCHRKKHN